MAKDNDNLLLIGGIAIAAFFLLKKKSTPVMNTGNTMYSPASNYRPGYNIPQTGGTGNIIQSTGSAIADIINAIKGKNVAVIEPAPAGFDYDAWAQQAADPTWWDTYYSGNYENYA